MPKAYDEEVLVVRDLTKTYASGDRQLTVVDRVSFSVKKGSSTAIVGPSGSGKTTLLGLCAGLDRPTSGSVALDGIDLGMRTEEELASIRNHHVGFVFQTFQLLPTLTALENVMVPLELRGNRNAASGARELLDRPPGGLRSPASAGLAATTATMSVHNIRVVTERLIISQTPLVTDPTSEITISSAPITDRTS